MTAQVTTENSRYSSPWAKAERASSSTGDTTTRRRKKKHSPGRPDRRLDRPDIAKRRTIQRAPARTIEVVATEKRKASWILVALAAMALLLPQTQKATATNPAQALSQPSPPGPRVRTPAYFEANQGQADPEAAFIYKGSGQSVAFYPDKFKVGLATYRDIEASGDRSPNAAHPTRREVAERSAVTFGLGSSLEATSISGENQLQGVVNYYIGDDQSRWVHEAPTFGSIRYQDVYDGIDLAFYTNAQGELEYDFVLAPGADPTRISLKVSGHNGLSLDAKGNLVISTNAGEMSKSRPVAQQESDSGGGSVNVPAEFDINGDSVGFTLGEFDRSRSLVIDPAFLGYSTFLGGTTGEEATDLGVDQAGNIYVAGTTTSTDFPTLNPYQPATAGFPCGFAAKLDPAGTSLIYSTYFGGGGGGGWNEPHGLAIDAEGGVVLVGETTSNTFPILNAFQPTFGEGAGAGTDGFVARFTSTGSLAFSTYLGGVNHDRASSVAISQSGDVHVVGSTQSPNFWTLDPYKGNYPGPATDQRDGFLSVVSPEGTLLRSTFLGGSAADFIVGVGIDLSDTVTVTGHTLSDDLGSTPSAIQSGRSDGYDIALYRWTNGDITPTYVSYFGGTGDDQVSLGSHSATGIDGRIHLAGQTQSTDFPVVSAIQPLSGGDFDTFITKLSPDASSVEYSTYFGGSGGDYVGGLTVDGRGNIYLSGQTGSPDLPIVGAIDSTFGSGPSGLEFDGFALKVNGDGSAIAYSTYLGGTGFDRIVANPALDRSNNLVAAGTTRSPEFPVNDAYQPTMSGGSDAFITKIEHHEPITGTVTGASSGSVSLYTADTGTQVAYSCCFDELGTFSVTVPVSECSQGAGYKALFSPAVDSYQPRWYNDKDNFTSADCIDSPSAGLTMTLPPATSVQGDITDQATGLPIDGAVIYAFKTDGTFANWTQSGYSGSGHYKLALSSGETYKILVVHGSMRKWFGEATNWTDAATCTNPCTANVSFETSSPVGGYVKAAVSAADVDGALIYAWNADTGQFAGWTKSGIAEPGRYLLSLPAGASYKVLAHPLENLEDRWSDGAPGFVEASAVALPATANFSLRDAGLITGTATAPGGGPRPNALIAAYTTCGCTTPQVAISGPDGSYVVKVASTTSSGWQYKLRYIGPSGGSAWYDSAPGFGGAGVISAPSSGVNQEVPA